MPVATRWQQNLLALGMGLLAAVLLVGPAESGVLDASWTAPTTNTDGSPLTDLASYRIYYGAVNPTCPGPSFFEVASPTPSPPADQTLTFRLTGLFTGLLYYAAVTAVDTLGNESDCSTVASASARFGFALAPTGTVDFGSVALGSFADRPFVAQNASFGTVTVTASTS